MQFYAAYMSKSGEKIGNTKTFSLNPVFVAVQELR